MGELIVMYVFIVILLFGGGGAAFVRNQLESRRRHQLEMKKQDRAIAEANAAQATATTRRLALDIRSAELEIERFDRRMGTTGLPATSRLTSGVDPEILRELTDSATADAATQEINTGDQPGLKKRKEKE